MVTSTGVSLRAGTILMSVTVPTVKPSRLTGAPTLSAGGILKIGAKHDLAGENAARAACHEEDESSQGCQRHDDQNAHLQL